MELTIICKGGKKHRITVNGDKHYRIYINCRACRKKTCRYYNPRGYVVHYIEGHILTENRAGGRGFRGGRYKKSSRDRNGQNTNFTKVNYLSSK